jgi:hypothetical protein
MTNDDPKPRPQPSGNQPPPRPPKHTAIAANPDDGGDDSHGKKPKKETVRINLPPKPGAAPTIKLPTLPPSSLLEQTAAAGLKLTKIKPAPALPQMPSRHLRASVGNTELGMILAAVLLLNGMLYVLCRL